MHECAYSRVFSAKLQVMEELGNVLILAKAALMQLSNFVNDRLYMVPIK